MLRLKYHTGNSIFIVMEDCVKEDMMITKLDKIKADLNKARTKRDEWEQRVKDLEKKYNDSRYGSCSKHYTGTVGRAYSKSKYHRSF